MPLDPFRNYDSWLEAPYQRAAAEGDAFVDWCEREDVDPDADDAWDKYEAARADAEDYAAESKYEAMRDDPPPDDIDF